MATPKSVDHDVTAVIHVGFIEGAEPYSWQTSEGILHGTVIYIFEEISKHLNYPNRVIYHSMPLNRATEKLIAGEIDVLLTAASEDLELHALPISKVTIAPIEAWTRRIQDCAPIEKAFQGKFATPYWFGELVKQFNATPILFPHGENFLKMLKTQRIDGIVDEAGIMEYRANAIGIQPNQICRYRLVNVDVFAWTHRASNIVGTMDHWAEVIQIVTASESGSLPVLSELVKRYPPLGVSKRFERQ